MRIFPPHIKLHCLALLFATVAFMAVPSAQAQTWIQWRSVDGGNNHYYAITPAATNWISAQRLADSWGGTLATITSSNEQHFVNVTFLTNAFEHMPLWIGLIDPATKGTLIGRVRQAKEEMGSAEAHAFEWVTGEPFNYSNWKSGEPNNSSPGENYVAMNWEYSKNPFSGFKGEWNDTPPEGTTGYSGNTDGPYFGLMERVLDRDQPVASHRLNWILMLMAVFTPFLVVWIGRKRRSAQRKGP